MARPREAIRALTPDRPWLPRWLGKRWGDVDPEAWREVRAWRAAHPESAIASGSAATGEARAPARQTGESRRACCPLASVDGFAHGRPERLQPVARVAQ